MKFRLILFLSLLINCHQFLAFPYKLEHLSNGSKNIFLIYDYDDMFNQYLGIKYVNGQYVIANGNIFNSGVEYDFDNLYDQTKLKEIVAKKGASVFDGKCLILDSEKTLLDKLIDLDQNSTANINILWDAPTNGFCQIMGPGHVHEFSFINWAADYLMNNLKRLKITLKTDFVIKKDLIDEDSINEFVIKDNNCIVYDNKKACQKIKKFLIKNGFKVKDSIGKDISIIGKAIAYPLTIVLRCYDKILRDIYDSDKYLENDHSLYIPLGIRAYQAFNVIKN